MVSLLALLIYSNTFHVPFHFDDVFVIVNNPIVRDLQYFSHPSGARQFEDILGYQMFIRRYVGYLTFALNYKAGGYHVWGYHLINLLVHIGTSLLVYAWVAISFGTPLLKASRLREKRRAVALFSALLFASHPVLTEAVTYVWQRVTTLSAALYCLSLVLYARWRLSSAGANSSRARSALWYAASFAAAALAMKTKETAFTLPLALALYEFMFFKGSPRRRLLWLLPYLLTMLIVPLGVMHARQPGEGLLENIFSATREQTDIPRAVYLFTQFGVIVTYLRLLLFPVNQNLDYDYPLSHGLGAGAAVSLAVILLLLAAGLYMLRLSRRSDPALRLLSFGVLAFFLSLSVESSVIPIADVIFEHRLYLPAIWLLPACAAGIFGLASGAVSARLRVGVVAVFALVIVASSIGTFHRNSVWRDSVALWQDTVRKSPGKGRPHATLGKAYQDRGLIQMAIEEYEAARRLDPHLTEARNNLGAAYAVAGQYDKAVSALEEAIGIDPNNPGSYSNLGNIYFMLGKTDMALSNYHRALELDPGAPEPRFNLIRLLLSLGRHGEAEQELERLRAVRPDLAAKIADNPAYRDR